MIPDGKNCHKFTKSDRVKNTKLLGKLKSEHESIPAAFEIVADLMQGNQLLVRLRSQQHIVTNRKVHFTELSAYHSGRCGSGEVCR